MKDYGKCGSSEYPKLSIFGIYKYTFFVRVFRFIAIRRCRVEVGLFFSSVMMDRSTFKESGKPAEDSQNDSTGTG